MTLTKAQIIAAVRSGERMVVTRKHGSDHYRDLGMNYALNLKDQQYDAEITGHEIIVTLPLEHRITMNPIVTDWK